MKILFCLLHKWYQDLSETVNELWINSEMLTIIFSDGGLYGSESDVDHIN